MNLAMGGGGGGAGFCPHPAAHITATNDAVRRHAIAQ